MMIDRQTDKLELPASMWNLGISRNYTLFPDSRDEFPWRKRLLWRLAH